MANPQKSIPELKLKLDNGQELFMSYGMFNDIMRLLGNAENVVELLLTDAGTRDLVIRRLFTETKKPIDSVDDLVNPYDLEISPIEIEKVVAWVADHAIHFTMSTVKSTKTVVQKYEREAASLDQSKSGSTN